MRPNAVVRGLVPCRVMSITVGSVRVLCSRALDVYQAMTQLPGLHPDSTLYRTIINALSACAAPKMVLQVALLMAQQVSRQCMPCTVLVLAGTQPTGALYKSCIDNPKLFGFKW